MVKIIRFIRSNTRQLIEVLILIGAVIIPFVFNLPEVFKQYLETNSIAPDNAFWYIAISSGGYISSIICFLFVIYFIRKINSEYMMNSSNAYYHDYYYIWYWFCSKILGIKKCNLILVPIYMQFKLVIRGTFDEYPLNDDEYIVLDGEADSKVMKTNLNAGTNEVNLILEDSFAIADQQIPRLKRQLLTIRISRNGGRCSGRHFSQIFIETIINELRNCKSINAINVFATTNPKNTIFIAKSAFASGGRGNIKHFLVYQQCITGIRAFNKTGHKIY